MKTRKILAGRTILVTRDAKQANALTAQLNELGAHVLEFPVISIQPPQSFDQIDGALSRIRSYDWIIFASVNAVTFFLRRYHQLSLDETLLSQCRFAAIGPATRRSLEQNNIRAEFVPDSFVAEAFVAEFKAKYDLANAHVLWPRTTVGRQLIKDDLEKAGATVDMVSVYETVLPPDSVARSEYLLQLLEREEIDFITLASSQSVKNFARLLTFAMQRTVSGNLQTLPKDEQSASLSRLLQSTQILSIGPETSKTIENELGCRSVTAETYTIAGIVEKLLELACQKE